jgi:hypothetical protein
MGAPWLPPETNAQLDWYKIHDDSEPIVVWDFSDKRIEPHSATLSYEGPALCSWGDWGLVLNAVNGGFIVEGFDGVKPTPYPTG